MVSKPHRVPVTRWCNIHDYHRHYAYIDRDQNVSIYSGTIAITLSDRDQNVNLRRPKGLVKFVSYNERFRYIGVLFHIFYYYCVKKIVG